MRVYSASLLLCFAVVFPSAAQQAAPAQPTLPVDAAGLPANAAQVQQQQQQLDHYRKVANDYGTLNRYAAADAALPPAVPGEKRVLFFGDSITDSWHLEQSFSGRNYINRGISGQTTPQMLVRFRQDVLRLNPAVLLVLAGTNDLAGNTGPETPTEIEDDYATMAELCRLHGIRLVFASVTPVNNYVSPQMTVTRAPSQILALNSWLQQYCAANGCTYLDYYTAMVDGTGMMRRELSNDGLHPNAAGYAVMTPLAQAAIDRALAAPVTSVAGQP